jgi:adenylate cyclase
MAKERVHRRLAAILVADVVGYSRMSEIDEEGTRARLLSLHAQFVDPEIADASGRVVKTTGDGILVEFASAVDAVRCALEIQQLIGTHNTDIDEDIRISFRIGINIGDVIVEGTDIHGDGVNVAARLEGLCEPGEVYVSGTVYDQVVGKLAADLENLGERKVKNVAKPVRVYRARLGSATSAKAKSSTAPVRTGPTERPSIAVLPFVILSQDREHEFIADGIVEDLTTHLARLPGFVVISRNSSFAYKGQAPDIREVGRDLGVRYVVEGSLRSMGQRIRITVQLINTKTGSHLWSDQFDRDSESIFMVHDELVAGIVGCIEPALASAEVEAIDRRQPGDLDAWHYFWMASSLIARRGWHGETFGEAESLLRKAIEIDPDFALAHARLALHLALGHLAGNVSDIAEVHSAAERAIVLDPNQSEVLGFAGCALQDVGTKTRGVDLLERAIELNPSNSQAWGALGAGYLMTSRPEEAIEKLEYAIRINPRDPFLRTFFGSLLAIALSRVGRIDDAIDRARAACRIEGGAPNPRITLAALLVLADRCEDALDTLREAKGLYPSLSFDNARGLVGGRLGKALQSIWAKADEAPG